MGLPKAVRPIQVATIGGRSRRLEAPTVLEAFRPRHFQFQFNFRQHFEKDFGDFREIIRILGPKVRHY